MSAMKNHFGCCLEQLDLFCKCGQLPHLPNGRYGPDYKQCIESICQFVMAKRTKRLTLNGQKRGFQMRKGANSVITKHAERSQLEIVCDGSRWYSFPEQVSCLIREPEVFKTLSICSCLVNTAVKVFSICKRSK